MNTGQKYLKSPGKELLEILTRPMNNTEITEIMHEAVNNTTRNRTNGVIKTLLKYGLVERVDGKYIKQEREVIKFFKK